jgi:hypothetical protein
MGKNVLAGWSRKRAANLYFLELNKVQPVLLKNKGCMAPAPV